jgi:PBP1b-binding outer membrane lipoprotein LpoB
MKRLAATIILAALLGGCAAYQSLRDPAPAAPAAAPVAARPTGPVDADGTPIQTLPFRLGVSSVTVEKMAKQQACTGGHGAALVTEAGPVEVYRMQCDNGKVFKARCEMRQCRQM